MTTQPQDLDASPDVFSRGAQLVKGLFDHLGVPKRERTSKLEELMGWSYHPALRRMKGDVPWTVDELELLATRCGMTLAAVISLADQEGGEAARFVLGGMRIPCRVWIQGPADAERSDPVVAIREDGKWLVVAAADVGSAPAHTVSRVVLQPEPGGPRPRVAVLDDSRDVTDTVCAYLRLVGMRAEPYFSFEQLSSALKEEPFDAYILDWLIGSASAASLVAEIRHLDPHCPIAVLTGKVREGKADQQEVATITTQYRAEFFEKPAQLVVIATKLKHALEELRTAGR